MPRVLIAEPNASLRQMLEAAFRAHGYDVATVETGDATLEQLGASDWSCVVLGAPVPLKKSSRAKTLLEHFEVEPPPAACRTIVMTTRVTNRSLLRRAARLKVYAVFAEPCDINDLMKTVAACVAGSAPERRWFGFPEPYLQEIFATSPDQKSW